MNDHDLETRLTTLLHERARHAEPRPDLDAVQSGAHTIMPIAPSTPRPRGRLLVAAAAAVLVAGGVTAGVLANRSNETVIAASSPTLTSTCIVFLQPTAAAAQIDDVGAQLQSRQGLHDLRYLSQDDAYAEFTTLFADKPDLLASVTADILPSSWRYDTPDGVDAAQAELRATLDAPSILEIRCNPYGQPLDVMPAPGPTTRPPNAPASTAVSGSPATARSPR